MTQLNLWQDESNDQDSSASVSTWKLFIDGASKRNPGPSGAGFSLEKDGEPVCQQGYFLGNKTNNQAEYFALLLGVFFSKKFLKKNDTFIITSDSQLLVRQMNGVYKIKDGMLRQIKLLADKWLRGYRVEIKHVLREFNVTADQLANRGVAKKILLPKDFLDAIEQEGITI